MEKRASNALAATMALAASGIPMPSFLRSFRAKPNRYPRPTPERFQRRARLRRLRRQWGSVTWHPDYLDAVAAIERDYAAWRAQR